jgi:hypothetical protein
MLVLGLIACSDDDGQTTSDGAPADSIGSDITVGDAGTDVLPTEDSGITPDEGVTPEDGAVTSDQGQGGDAAEPTVLNQSHSCWMRKSCSGSGCHILPLPGHTQTEAPQCAECHGGNGSCNPNGPNSGMTGHSPSDSCTACHPTKHGYNTTADCVSCHYATAGTVDCN